jgi:hypothetical protein
MTNLVKLEFMTLHITDNNYLSWVLDVKIHHDVMGLEDIIKAGNKASSQNKAKIMIF